MKQSPSPKKITLGAGMFARSCNSASVREQWINKRHWLVRRQRPTSSECKATNSSTTEHHCGGGRMFARVCQNMTGTREQWTHNNWLITRTDNCQPTITNFRHLTSVQTDVTCSDIRLDKVTENNCQTNAVCNHRRVEPTNQFSISSQNYQTWIIT